jgi:hypothetical protein
VDDEETIRRIRDRVRAAGEAWAVAEEGADRFSELTACLVDVIATAGGATTDPAELVKAAAAGCELMKEILAGIDRGLGGTGDRQDLAARRGGHVEDLIAGRSVPRQVEAELARGYLVAVIRYPEPGRPAVETLVECGGPGTMAATIGANIVLLTPDHVDSRSRRLVDSLNARTRGRAWTSMAAGNRADIPEAYREAVEVLEIVLAGCRGHGVYHLRDVLVEYAVTRHEGVSDSLAAIVRPLMAHPVLRDTLIALIRADYNRNRAAKILLIHRSTLDYRLQRIRCVTGYDPTSPRDGQVLAMAMTAHLLSSRSATT